MHTTIYNINPNLKIPKPLLAIEKVTPEGVVYHEFVMEALKNPSASTGYAVSLENIFYGKATNIQLPATTLDQIKTELNKLHATGYIHGDFGPHNVMYVIKEGKPSFYISDFSHAKPATTGTINNELVIYDILIKTNVYRHLAGLPPLQEQELLQLIALHRPTP